ncbi:hypothetical protein M2336_001670 [Sphingobium sp. B1D7B]|uniref:major capsid protein n=1 Tax=Sphingobium sp. B1D7B TaxID=2940578 RepID=UPI00222563B7|nr:hypothetical protein [Sphingobium sp. B1D7B]MCW2405041.1 hypothetical protein [Sphingobium sp. B1D7B]
MATIGNSFLGLIDLYKREGKYGNLTPVIEALNTINPLGDDAVYVECNQGREHLTTIRTGLPSVTWGKLYQGIPNSKSTTTQVTDTTGFVEGRSQVDERLLALSKNPGAVRMSEAQPFLESIAQDVQTNFFYSDTTTTPERFKGLGARYNTLSNPNVISGGGAGSDNTSIWFVTWGEQQTALIYPEGTAAGVDRVDRGSQQVADDLGNYYFAKVEEFRQHVGVTVKDWRFNSRIANIDVSNALAGSVDVFDLMTTAYYRMQNRRNRKIQNGGMINMGRTVIYMNRDMLSVLDRLSTNNGSSDNFIRLRPQEIEGKEVMTWRGIPIRETDALINAESVVS